MSSATLRDEISNDPLLRGYDVMSDIEVAEDLNTAYRSRDKRSITGSAVWNHTDSTEFTNLQNNAQQRWLALCGVDDIDPFGPAVEVATDIFASDSTTLSQLSDFRTETITRAEELGLGDVQPYDVTKAREQLGLV